MPRGPTPLSADAHMASPDQHSSGAANAACQQHSQDINLLHCTPLMTQPLGQEKECWPKGNAELAGRQQAQQPPLQHPQDVCDLHTARKPEDYTAASSLSSDSVMADAALPVSQVLPDTAMELWDFGGDEQPEYDHATAGLGADCKAAEAFRELTEFCKSENLARFPDVFRGASKICSPFCTIHDLNGLATHTLNTWQFCIQIP